MSVQPSKIKCRNRKSRLISVFRKMMTTSHSRKVGRHEIFNLLLSSIFFFLFRFHLEGIGIGRTIFSEIDFLNTKVIHFTPWRTFQQYHSQKKQGGVIVSWSGRTHFAISRSMLPIALSSVFLCWRFMILKLDIFNSTLTWKFNNGVWCLYCTLWGYLWIFFGNPYTWMYVSKLKVSSVWPIQAKFRFIVNLGPRWV